MRQRKTTNLVFPGQRVATIEEYIAKHGAYEDQNGIIRSLFYGRVIIDEKNKELLIDPIRKMRLLVVGDYVLARIINITGLYGFVNIFAIKEEKFRSLDRIFSGILHPPRSYENLLPYKLGDYIFGKVVSNKNRTFHLSIEEKELGVILAFCPICGQRLIKSVDNKLLCIRCRIYEYRKISVYYGRVI